MSDYEKHVQAIENRCRICFQKKSCENLRKFNENLIRLVRDSYEIDFEYESQLCYFPQHICKGCASSIMKGRPPKLASLNLNSCPRKVTTKQSGTGCSICETFPGEVGRPLFIQKNLPKDTHSSDPIVDTEASNSPAPKRICWSSP